MLEDFVGPRSWLIGLTDFGHEGRYGSIQCSVLDCVASVININRWIWDHSIEDADFTSWAPGYPRSDNSKDDCAILSSSNGYKWTDIRF